MSSLRPQDRKSLCRFTFADGRQCRTARSPGHSLSACDLSAALGRLLPAVVRGDVKPRSARTLAYLSQTLVQTIHLAEHEYTNAFGDDSWRKAVRNSVHQNFDYLNPSPSPEPPPDQVPQPPSQPVPSPHTPLPKTSTEFFQHVMAGLPTEERSLS